MPLGSGAFWTRNHQILLGEPTLAGAGCPRDVPKGYAVDTGHEGGFWPFVGAVRSPPVSA